MREFGLVQLESWCRRLRVPVQLSRGRRSLYTSLTHTNKPAL